MLPDYHIELLYKFLGSAIREIRTKKGIGQKEFAEAMNLSRGSLVNIEKGRQKAPLHVIYAMSDILEVKLSDLLPSFEKLQNVDHSVSNEKRMDKLGLDDDYKEDINNLYLLLSRSLKPK